MIHTYSGKSLNELYALYGDGENGFFSHWWKDEAFANDKASAGEYELNVESRQFENMTFDEQKAALPHGFDFPHPAVLAEALIEYYKKTGKYLMDNWHSRTSLLDSDGYRVFVGYCDSVGVGVNYGWDDYRIGRVGLAAARKSEKTLEPRTLDPLDPLALEFRIKNLESAVAKLQRPKKTKRA